MTAPTFNTEDAIELLEPLLAVQRAAQRIRERAAERLARSKETEHA